MNAKILFSPGMPLHQLCTASKIHFILLRQWEPPQPKIQLKTGSTTLHGRELTKGLEKEVWNMCFN
jgi:hypothetical protein